MNKLRVSDTALKSITFAITRLGTTFKVLWLGVAIFIAILAAAGYVFFRDIFEVIIAGDESYFEDPDNIAQFISTYIGFIAIALIASLALIPGKIKITQIAAGVSDVPNGIGYFKFGGEEIRYVGGYIVYMIISISAIAVLSIPLIGIGASTGWEFDGGGSSAFISIYALLAIIAYIWFMIRLVAFLPLVAIENRLAPMRAFRMTGGNFWRIIGAGLLFILLLIVASIVISIAMQILMMIFMGVGMVTTDGGTDFTNPGAIVTIGSAVLLYLIIEIITLLFQAGAGAAFGANIYNQLKDNTN
ncbi:MAG: hypothetical protein ACWA5L_11145 [bacterium]